MSVYRPLFVELSKDLFDIVKGITEQAAKRAQEREALGSPFKHSPVTGMLWAVNEKPIVDWLCERYGWKRFAISRCAYNTSIEVSARLLCGHVIECAPIGERELHLLTEPAAAFIDALDRSVARAARCYCVPREAA